LENAGSVAALEKIRDANVGISVIVWVADKEDWEKVKAIGVDQIFDVKEGLDAALKTVGNVVQDKVVIVGSSGDRAAITTEFFKDKLQIKKVWLSRPQAQDRRINAMPLIFAQVVASILNDQEAVVKKARNMCKPYIDSGLNKDEYMAALNDITNQLDNLPLAVVTEEVAKIQLTFEETMDKI
jgi:hypothetical protein